MATSFSGGRSRSTRGEPPTMGKQLVNLSLAAASRVTLFCNLQSRARTHAVLVIGLYELLGNPTTYLIEPPGPRRFMMNLSSTTVYVLIVNIVSFIHLAFCFVSFDLFAFRCPIKRLSFIVNVDVIVKNFR